MQNKPAIAGYVSVTYIILTHEVDKQTKWVKVDDGDEIDTGIVEGLIRMLDDTNHLVRKFRYARDHFREEPIRDTKIKIKVSHSESGRENNIGLSKEVAIVMVEDEQTTVGERDIILEKQNKDLERISTFHPLLMALQYPLLFPAGEDVYHDEISYVDPENQYKKKRKRITMKEYYAYRLQSCHWWLRTHQTILRNDLYSNIAKKVRNGNLDSTTTGKGFVLLANFMGSKRYMQQNFQDALAVCRVVGHPDIFLMMTCNSQWNEIQEMMKKLPGCSASDSPDIISLAFHLKVEHDINSKSKKNLSTNVDKYVSAELPDPETDPVGYAVVQSIMIHGPCGMDNPKWQNGGNTEKSDEAVDENNEYFDGRYICASEAAHRIFGFLIHHRSIYVHRLSFHLPGQRSCTFQEQECLQKVVNFEKYRHSPLEAFFQLNRTNPNFGQYTYDEIPQFNVWNDTDQIWTPRSCRHYGLLDDDNEWHEVLSDAAKSSFPGQIHHLFVHIIVNCQVTDIRHLWNEHLKNMIDDIILGRRDKSGGLQTILNEKQLEFYALVEIDKLLRCIGKSLEHFKQLPIPPRSYLQTGSNNLVIDETSYDMSEMAAEFDKRFPKCYLEQLHIYNAVLQSVQENAGGLFFAYGSGGCAATLMPGGRTAHSRFKIPIILDDYSSCGIGHDSDIADIIRLVHPSKYELPFGVSQYCLVHHAQIYILKKNMRLNQGQSEEEVANLKNFFDWVLEIGNGKVAPPLDGLYDYVEDDIIVPD
ncbi:uncharacterized protein LOC141665475 [Apium graveolens]|uniref:uncharacterized protein LOC141665475 n=1 Tax=Apium graveolens TaxID=4045 RepID=UPI003D791E34